MKVGRKFGNFEEFKTVSKKKKARSSVSVRIGISWSVQYCVSKDRDLLVCTVLCQ